MDDLFAEDLLDIMKMIMLSSCKTLSENEKEEIKSAKTLEGLEKFTINHKFEPKWIAGTREE